MRRERTGVVVVMVVVAVVGGGDFVGVRGERLVLLARRAALVALVGELVLFVALAVVVALAVARPRRRQAATVRMPVRTGRPAE